MTDQAASVLGVGTVALDSVETSDGKVVDAPGGSALYFGAAARCMASVAVAGVVGEDFPEAPLTALAERGVDVSGVARRPGETFRWKVRYDADLKHRETLETNRGVTLQVSPVVPERFRSPDIVFLGSTNPSVQREVLHQMVDPKTVVLDTMTHWITDRLDDLVALLEHVDVLLVNEEEAKLLGGSAAPPLAARKIRGMGPAWVVIKRGVQGAVAFGPAADVAVPARKGWAVVDPTGAGDAFAGGFVGALAGAPSLDVGAMRRALAAGAVTGALAVASFSFDALLEVEASEVRAALRR